MRVMIELKPSEIIDRVLCFVPTVDILSLLRVNRLYLLCMWPTFWRSIITSCNITVEATSDTWHCYFRKVVDSLFPHLRGRFGDGSGLSSFQLQTINSGELTAINSIDLNFRQMRRQNPWLTLSRALRFPHLQRLQVEGLVLWEDENAAAKHPLEAPSRLRDLRFIDCQDGDSCPEMSFSLENTLRRVKGLETFIIEKNSYTQSSVDRILLCLSHLQASLRRLIIATIPEGDPPKHAFHPINLQGFKGLHSLSLPVSFLYWEWLSAYTAFDRLPPNLECLQIQFCDPLNAYCGQHFEFRATTLGKTMDNLAAYAHSYCPALQCVWWWYPKMSHCRARFNELRRDEDAGRIQVDELRERLDRPPTMASKFSFMGIQFEYTDRTQLDQTPLLRLIPRCL